MSPSLRCTDRRPHRPGKIELLEQIAAAKSIWRRRAAWRCPTSAPDLVEEMNADFRQARRLRADRRQSTAAAR